PVWSLPQLILLVLMAGASHAQAGISGKVIDDTGVAVAKAQIEARIKGSDTVVSAVSDASGSFTLQLPAAAEESPEIAIRVSRQGYFVYSGVLRPAAQAAHLTITLNHLQEFAESIDVRYSPPAIDTDETADKKQLNNIEVQSVPYPAP